MAARRKAGETASRRTYDMLKLIDLGCKRHKRRYVTLSGIEAQVMEDILYNLQRVSDSHIFICEHGHTHHVYTLDFPVREISHLPAGLS
jgi:hypothetical protein